jgi:two-component system, chemotaxis family, response regulator Rcp1
MIRKSLFEVNLAGSRTGACCPTPACVLTDTAVSARSFFQSCDCSLFPTNKLCLATDLLPSQQKQLTRMKPLRILLVEDRAADIRLIREALKETPVPVDITVACDGVEALDMLRGSENRTPNRPDLILLDLNLPRKNGIEVLAEVKSSPEWKQIPVLVMTSSHADEDITQAYSLNANCYITKPGDLSEYIN